MRGCVIAIIILCLFLPACATKSTHERPIDYVTVIANLPDCKRPEKVKIAEIDNSQHIGSVDNTIDLDEVIVSLYLYNQQLESTIDCYQQRFLKAKEAYTDQKQK